MRLRGARRRWTQLAALSNAWNAVVIWALRDGPRRPVELRERIGGISSKVLTETLRRLQSNGLVDREAHPGAPPRVEYRLTALGRTLLASIDAVGAWAVEHGDEVMAAQEAECTGAQGGTVRAAPARVSRSRSSDVLLLRGRGSCGAESRCSNFPRPRPPAVGGGRTRMGQPASIGYVEMICPLVFALR